MSRLRLPLPFLFKLAKGTKAPVSMPSRSGKTKRPFEQYCGVMEFSADKGKCFIPKWMMRNLKTKEGGNIVISSQRGVRASTTLTWRRALDVLLVCHPVRVMWVGFSPGAVASSVGMVCWRR